MAYVLYFYSVLTTEDLVCFTEKQQLSFNKTDYFPNL